MTCLVLRETQSAHGGRWDFLWRNLFSTNADGQQWQRTSQPNGHYSALLSTKIPLFEIQSDATVGALKDAIKLKKQPDFDGFPADKLTLHHVNLPDDDNLAENVKQPLTKPLTALKATEELSDLFSEAPAKKTVHILVRAPALGK